MAKKSAQKNISVERGHLGRSTENDNSVSFHAKDSKNSVFRPGEVACPFEFPRVCEKTCSATGVLHVRL
jgi:hypothetical protein